MIKNLVRSFLEYFIRNIPGGIGRKIRYSYYKLVLGGCGKDVYIDIGVVITDPRSVFLGNHVWIDNYVLILSGPPGEGRKIYRKANPKYQYKEGELHIGDNVHIAPMTVIQSHGGVMIGANSGVASGSRIYSFSNHYKDLNEPADVGPFHFTPLAPLKNQAYVLSPVVLEEDTAIGLNSVVLPGTTVTKGTWLGVSSYIQGAKIEPDSVYSSEMAKFIKRKNG
ncbi:LPS biosynthesis O-acetyl transferase [Cytophagales bacterium WSM2-2]|nr:LPS biosynthesis O-acetyl transferase [Cytophagales bacterium WSM2-2]